MTNLTHSAAHERLADLSLEPVALRAFAADVAAPAGAGDSPLHRHVRECDACRAEIDGWLGLHDTVTAALAGPASPVTLEQLAAAEPITAPPALRSAVAQIDAQCVTGPRPNVRGGRPCRSRSVALPSLSSANPVAIGAATTADGAALGALAAAARRRPGGGRRRRRAHARSVSPPRSGQVRHGRPRRGHRGPRPGDARPCPSCGRAHSRGWEHRRIRRLDES